MLVGQILLAALIGALLCTDRIFIQAMVSRPIVIAPVIGLVLGNPYPALMIGAIFELLWMDRLPVGIYTPPNDSMAAAVAASVAILVGKSTGGVKPDLIAVCVLLAIPVGLIAQKFDGKMMQANNLFSDQALENAKKRDFRAIERKVYVALARVFLFYFVLLFAVQMIFVLILNRFYPALPLWVNNGLTLIYYFMPILGGAVALNTIKVRGAIPVFCAIFLAATIAREIFHVF